jgi:glycine hydroxymethyltransferase
MILMGQDFDNPFGLTTPKGEIRPMSALLDGAIFPGIQGGPLEHVIGAKAVAFGEALTDSYFNYILQVRKNAQALSAALQGHGFSIVSGGTDNHLMLIDLRNKNITGKEAETVLGTVHITANKNMVPFDSQSPFVTSGIRLGTPAVTSRGLVESDMHQIADWIQEALVHKDQTAVLADIANRVKGLMEPRPLFVG